MVTTRSLSPEICFLKFTIFIPDNVLIIWCQSGLCCNVRIVLPKVSQLHSSQQENLQNGFKLDPSESVLGPLRAIKRKERLSI